MRTVIGLDPSLTSFGMCLYDLDTGDVTTASIGDKTAAKDLQDRLARYDRILTQVLAFLTTDRMGQQIVDDLKLIAIEGYALGAKGNAHSGLCEFGGILRNTLVHQYGLSVVEVHPSTLKKFITGKGGGKGTDKAAMTLATYKRYGVEFGTSDEVDAYGLARIAACLVGAEPAQTAFQREVIEKTLGGNKSAAQKVPGDTKELPK